MGTNDQTPLLSRQSSLGSANDESERKFCLCIPYSWISNSGRNPRNAKNDVYILLLSAMIGTGIFAQPHCFMENGILLMLVIYIVVALLIWLSVSLLIHLAERLGCYNYMGICHLVFGQLGHRVLNFTMILGYISALVSYLITIGNLTASVMTTLVDNVNERGNINWLTRPMFMSIMITLIFIFPICMIRRYGHMAWISKCSIFLVIISVLFVILVGSRVPTFYFTNHSVSNLTDLNWFTLGGKTICETIGVVVFAFSFNSAVFPSYNTLSPRSSRVLQEINMLTIASGALLCLLMGIWGYLAFVNTTDDNIMQNFKSEDFFSLPSFLKLVIVFHLVIYIPQEFLVMRNCIYDLFDHTDDTTSDYVHLITTIGALFLSQILACYLMVNSQNAFNTALSISGGLCGSAVIFIFPGVMSTLISHKVAEKASAKYHSVEDFSKLVDQYDENSSSSNKFSSHSLSRDSFLDNDDVFHWLGYLIASFGILLCMSTIYIHLF